LVQWHTTGAIRLLAGKSAGKKQKYASATTGQFGKIKAMPGKKDPGISPQIQSRGMPHIQRVREALQEMMDKHAYDRPSNRISSTNTVYAKRPLRQRLRSPRLFGKIASTFGQARPSVGLSG
jgi:hypothetical protein